MAEILSLIKYKINKASKTENTVGRKTMMGVKKFLK
jgi:hypothetical protein